MTLGHQMGAVVPEMAVVVLQLLTGRKAVPSAPTDALYRNAPGVA